MSKMSEVMPKWGPYSKKYSGVSRVTEHETEKGVRFDFISLPAVSNTDAKAPNVTIPVGVHPWDVKSDYSFYSYRQDLEWKDVIYSDVSFTKLSDESVLIRTEIFNNSELMQNCLVNYFSSLQFPFLTSYRVSLPNKSLMFDALDYSEFTYKTSRPWDNETMDAMHKGEFFDDRFITQTLISSQSYKFPQLLIISFHFLISQLQLFFLNVRLPNSQIKLICHLVIFNFRFQLFSWKHRFKMSS